MACGACGGRKTAGKTQEYLITYRDNSTERVSDLTTVRQKITLNGGGTYRMVDKTTK